MPNNSISLADLMNSAIPDETAVLNDANGIFEVERTENGCCLRINSDENCIPFIMSAIAKYAESHTDFDTELVTFSEPAQEDSEDETEKPNRWAVDENFSLINTADGRVIWNKAENKPFTFSYTYFSNSSMEEVTVNVKEMRYCMRIGRCVYAFCTEEESAKARIGLVDVGTGTVIAPMFSKIMPYTYSGTFVGIYIDDREDAYQHRKVFFYGISTDEGLEITGTLGTYLRVFVGSFCIDLENVLDEDGAHPYVTGYMLDDEYDRHRICFNLPEDKFFDIFTGEYPSDDSYCYADFFPVEMFVRYRELKWVRYLEIDFSKLFSEDEDCEGLFPGGMYDNVEWLIPVYLREDTAPDSMKYWISDYEEHYSLGDTPYNLVRTLLPVDEYGTKIYSVFNGKYALILRNKLITGYDFTNPPSLIFDDDGRAYILAEIYGKFGVLIYDTDYDELKTLLPIEFGSVKYISKASVYFKNKGEERHEPIRDFEGFVASRMGRCALFSLKGKQLIPFYRENEVEIKDAEDKSKDSGHDFSFLDDL